MKANKISFNYSHAAPYIRRRLIDEVAMALHSPTQRDKRAAWKAVGAFATCLEIMHDAGDQTEVGGIPDVGSAPIDALRETLRFFGVLDREHEVVDPTARKAIEILSAEGVEEMLARIDEYNTIQERSRS